jgi:sucrose phosphorylase
MENSVHQGAPVPDFAEFATALARHLQLIYKSAFSEGLVNRILAITNKRFAKRPVWSEKDVILITYGNSLYAPDEKPLQTLYRFLHDRLAGTISCVHILPFFPSTSDDGFAVSDFMKVDPSLGSWEDITAFTPEFSIMSDLVINHISSGHPWFKNYLQNRDAGKDYFIEAEPGADYSQVARPRSTPLFTRVETVCGMRNVWTTFSEDQVDLNFSNPEVLIEMVRILVFYISRGIRIIRLDAIAFLWKQAGTNCLHLPETHEIVKLLRDIASFVGPGTVILTETNVPNKENWSYFGDDNEAHMVYQFGLPPLLLHALFSGNANYLTDWATEIPSTVANQTFLNFAASHDGIGIRPLENILPQAEINMLIKGMTDFGGLISRKTNTDGSLSPYEINITYLDAMKGDKKGADNLQESRFLCSQTIMMSLQGIPAFYIHSLIGAANDYNGIKSTGRARSINRRRYCEDELNNKLSSDTIHRRLFNELVRIIGIRKHCSAFHPGSAQKILSLGDTLFAFTRHNHVTGEKIYCISNVTGRPVEIKFLLPEKKKGYDLILGDQFDAPDPILLSACQTRWIVEQDVIES